MAAETIVIAYDGRKSAWRALERGTDMIIVGSDELGLLSRLVARRLSEPVERQAPCDRPDRPMTPDRGRRGTGGEP